MAVNAINSSYVSNPFLNAFSAVNVNRNNNLYAQRQSSDEIPQYKAPVVQNDILANKLDIMA